MILQIFAKLSLQRARILGRIRGKHPYVDLSGSLRHLGFRGRQNGWGKLQSLGQARRHRSGQIRFDDRDTRSRVSLQPFPTKLSASQDGHGGRARFLSWRDGELGPHHVSRIQIVVRRGYDFGYREAKHRLGDNPRINPHVVWKHDHARMVELLVAERSVCQILPIFCHCRGKDIECYF